MDVLPTEIAFVRMAIMAKNAVNVLKDLTSCNLGNALVSPDLTFFCSEFLYFVKSFGQKTLIYFCIFESKT